MSVFALIINASFVVQLVMLTLLAASVVSWVVIVQRGRLLNASRAQLLDFEERFWSGIDLNELYRECQQKPDPSEAENVFIASLKEFSRMLHKNRTGQVALIAGLKKATQVAINQPEDTKDNALAYLAFVEL